MNPLKSRENEETDEENFKVCRASEMQKELLEGDPDL